MLAIEKNGVIFYQSHLITVPHGFSTRIGGVSTGDQSSLNLIYNENDTLENVSENYKRFCSATQTPNNHFARNHQVHGDTIHRVSSGLTLNALLNPDTPHAEGDGLLTSSHNLTLVAYSGDCVPILFHDPVRGVVGAVHSGWRGTALGIAGKAVQSMVNDYGCSTLDIKVAIGPSIHSCCFSCHDDVSDAMCQALGINAYTYLQPEGDKYAIDLIGINHHWLTINGIHPDNIDSEAPCTACNPDNFWSHRKSGEARGSMASVIALSK